MHSSPPPESDVQPTRTSSPTAPAPAPTESAADAVAAVAVVALAALAVTRPVRATLAVEVGVAAWYLGPPAVGAVASLVRERRPPTADPRAWLAD